MSAIELLPCPFCGGEATTEHDATVEENHAYGCRRCGLWFDTFNSDDAITAWNRRTDLSQAAVAAALEAEAARLDNEAAILDADALRFRGGSDANYTRQVKAITARTYANSIRALITDRDRDALAAHVAAEVAKARAEDADLLYNAWLGLRVLENIAKVKGLSGAADVTTPLLAEIEAAHPEFAPRSALRAQIGAKP